MTNPGRMSGMPPDDERDRAEALPSSTQAMRALEEVMRRERMDVIKEGVRSWLEEHPEEQKAIIKEALTEWLEEHPAAQKNTIKEAIDEWLDAQILRFGKFSIYSLFAAVLAVFGYMWLQSKGFKG